MPFKDGAQSADVLIETDSALQSVIDRCGDLVGIDTEFIRTETFFPIPALYQLSGDDGVSLIDAQADQSFAGLKSLLTDDARTKIMHASSEDLEVIEHHLDVVPVNLVDTQLAHAFLSPHFSKSYQGLVEEYLAIKLPKHETRSNWLRRPLTDEQIAYAREDALHLVSLWSTMRDLLAEQGRLSWFDEEMTRTLERPVDDPYSYYRGMKRASVMSPQQLAVLKRLSVWRELEARRRNVPRARTVWDAHLVAIAETVSVTRGFLYDLLPQSVARRYADEILDAHDRGTEEDELPQALPAPVTQREGQVIKDMRDFGRGRALELGIAPELLARRREVEACVLRFRGDGDLPVSMRGWRAPFVGKRFLATMQSGLR